jgi:prophage regulatory protein
MVRKLLRKTVVLEATGWSNSTLYTKIAQGKFPKPVKIDPKGRASGWWEDEVVAIQNRATERQAEAARSVLSRKAEGAAIVVMTIRPPRIDQLATAVNPDFTLTPLDLQASKIGRRFNLSASVATAIALIAFANGRAA